MKDHLKQFYKKSLPERLTALSESGLISQAQASEILDSQLNLEAETGNHMIENYVANYSLPMGLAFHFVINDKNYVVPMAVEEPSVIAAASNGAKTVAQSGGFKTQVDNRMMIGQIALYQSEDLKADKARLEEAKDQLIELANQAYPSIVKRGGGARNIEIRIVDGDQEEDIQDYLVLHLHVDTQEAMGANMLNTMLEALAPKVESLTSGTVLMSILTNYATESLVTATCEISPDLLEAEGIDGQEVRDKIAEASKFAYVDPYRAATNNKGIMNGVDAAVVASGNDWRAIEAGVHTYAAKDGQYRSLTKWRVNDAGNLTGELTLPMPIASVGGSIGFHPGAKLTQQILGQPTAKELAQIIVAVGLAQNFAAIKALTTSGIQKGHMALQAKSLAINAGASGDEVEALTAQLIQADKMNLQVAKDLLADLRH